LNRAANTRRSPPGRHKFGGCRKKESRWDRRDRENGGVIAPTVATAETKLNPGLQKKHGHDESKNGNVINGWKYFGRRVHDTELKREAEELYKGETRSCWRESVGLAVY